MTVIRGIILPNPISAALLSGMTFRPVSKKHPNKKPIKPGDMLYVQEDYAPRRNLSGSRCAFDRNPRYIKYRNDPYFDGKDSPREDDDYHSWPSEWQPAKKMPIWAARYLLTVFDVRKVTDPLGVHWLIKFSVFKSDA